MNMVSALHELSKTHRGNFCGIRSGELWEPLTRPGGRGLGVQEAGNLGKSYLEERRPELF